MSRYENATDDVIKLASRTIDSYFSDLSNVKIKYLFDTKKSTRNGKIVLGRCQKPNDLTKHFTLSESSNNINSL